MKRVCSMLLIFLLLSFGANTSAEQTAEYAATTDKRIFFSNIPWNITVSDFNNSLDSIGMQYRSTYTEYGNIRNSLSSSSTSFGDGDVIPIISSKYVPTCKYWIQPENVYSDLCKVAGHSVSWIYASFYDQYPTRLYEIDIHIASSKLLSAKEQYDDLKGKLTELYGEPYSYFEENLSTAQDCSVWIGSDGTAVYLKCYHFKERDSESTILCYGLQTSGDTFVLIEEQAISETEQRKNDAMDSIADDYSGL